MSDTYDPQQIELKWQNRWENKKVFEAHEDTSRPKYYVLEMFPYPSGRLHMGHVRNYTIGDVIARFRRAQGFNVLHPMGWDAFGLPAENAAIKHQLHPEKWTLENIANMRRQLKRLGLSYDWSREIATCLPEYYKWEQKIFIEMYKKGLVYRKSSTVNWCPNDQTVLANEQVVEGKCWRCETETTTRELDQWFLRTTAYAQELLDDLDTLEGWPDRIKSMQRHWIGRSEGAEIEFGVDGHHGKSIHVFTTRPDTLFGVSYVALAPEHPLVQDLIAGRPQAKAVQNFIETCRKQDRIARTAEDAPKLGEFTGAYAIHPLTEKKVPIYVANFVLMDYGTGALMAVPAHDVRDHAFAKKYQIDIIEVIRPTEDEHPSVQDAAYTGPGKLIHSGAFDGQDSEMAKLSITETLEKKSRGKKTVQFKLRDWGLSRQRYWGTPIPMLYCEDTGEAFPEEDSRLPVVLPKDVEFSGEGGSPLAKHPDFLKTPCSHCKSGFARRETDTMDTFMESSWYYLRYMSPQASDRPFDPEAVAYWGGIDQYIGGVEHATMHLLYFRFFHKVLRDLGYLPKTLPPQDLKEPARALLNQGIVYKDGAKMSKSKGNVVEPDDIIQKYGCDTARLFSLFAAPPEKALEWSDQGVEGSYRFLGRVWRWYTNHEALLAEVAPYSGSHQDLAQEATKKLRSKTHQTIAKVRHDFDNGYHFNTAISAIMELVNELYTFPIQMGMTEQLAVLREGIETVVRLLHPFAPHMTEELWERMGRSGMLSTSALPEPDPEALIRDSVTVVVQVNGKLRGEVHVGVALEKDKIIALAQEHEKVSPYLQGKELVRTIFVPGKLVNFVVK